jgi:hypothetical protein
LTVKAKPPDGGGYLTLGLNWLAPEIWKYPLPYLHV